MNNRNVKIPTAKILPGSVDATKPLVSFEFDEAIYHIVIHPEGEGAIGVRKGDDDFSVKMTLDSFAAFYNRVTKESSEYIKSKRNQDEISL